MLQVWGNPIKKKALFLTYTLHLLFHMLYRCYRAGQSQKCQKEAVFFTGTLHLMVHLLYRCPFIEKAFTQMNFWSGSIKIHLGICVAPT
jgi:hypothetical protein